MKKIYNLGQSTEDAISDSKQRELHIPTRRLKMFSSTVGKGVISPFKFIIILAAQCPIPDTRKTDNFSRKIQNYAS